MRLRQFQLQFTRCYSKKKGTPKLSLTKKVFVIDDSVQKCEFPASSILNKLSTTPLEVPPVNILNREILYSDSRCIRITDGGGRGDAFMYRTMEDIAKAVKIKELTYLVRYVKPSDARFQEWVDNDLKEFRKMVNETVSEIKTAYKYNYNIDVDKIENKEMLETKLKSK